MDVWHNKKFDIHDPLPSVIVSKGLEVILLVICCC